MAKEIECKILGMSVMELLGRGLDRGVHLDEKGFHADAMEVTDRYWKFPDSFSGRKFPEVRYRTSCRKEDPKYATRDLTIKGREENDGKYSSERDELIIPIDPEVVADPHVVEKFLHALGGRLTLTVVKERIFIENELGVRIQHDSLEAHGIEMEWVEIEADTLKELHDFMFALGVGEFRHRVSNKTTLDLIDEVKTTNWEWAK